MLTEENKKLFCILVLIMMVLISAHLTQHVLKCKVTVVQNMYGGMYIHNFYRDLQLGRHFFFLILAIVMATLYNVRVSRLHLHQKYF